MADETVLRLKWLLSFVAAATFLAGGFVLPSDTAVGPTLWIAAIALAMFWFRDFVARGVSLGHSRKLLGAACVAAGIVVWQGSRLLTP